MGKLLHSIHQSDLYSILGYESLTHLVEEELVHSPNTASSYMSLYRNFARLHYNKAEALKLIGKYGYTNVREVLKKTNTKLGVRAMGNRIKELDQNQINFTLTDKELAEAHRALKSMGAVRDKAGRFAHSSSAFMEMVKEVNKKPKLKIAS